MTRPASLVLLCLILSTTYIGCSKPAPVLSTIAPQTGPTGGGTEVTVTGEGIEVGLEVSIGGVSVPVTSLAPDGTSFAFVTPGGAPGPQEVVVRVGDKGAPSSPMTFTYEPLSLSTLSPAADESFPADEAPSEISATFDQPIQPEGAVLKLVGDDTESRYDADTQSLVLTLENPPAAGREHQIEISGVKDLAGNALADQTSTFSVEAKPARSRGSSPSVGSTSVGSASVGSAPGRTYDEDRLQTSFFGRDLPFVEADKVDYLWVREGFEIDGHTFHFLPWGKPQFLGRIGAKRDAKDHQLAESMNPHIAKAFANILGQTWAGRAKTSTSSGNIKVRGRIVDCSTGSTAAKVIVGFGAGAGKTTFDLKFTDAATGELVMAIHHRVVSGTVWSTTDSKFVKWMEKFGKAAEKKGLGTLYRKGDKREK